MKKIILTILLISLSINLHSQKHTLYSDKNGIIITFELKKIKQQSHCYVDYDKNFRETPLDIYKVIASIKNNSEYTITPKLVQIAMFSIDSPNRQIPLLNYCQYESIQLGLETGNTHYPFFGISSVGVDIKPKISISNEKLLYIFNVDKPKLISFNFPGYTYSKNERKKIINKDIIGSGKKIFVPENKNSNDLKLGRVNISKILKTVPAFEKSELEIKNKENYYQNKIKQLQSDLGKKLKIYDKQSYNVSDETNQDRIKEVRNIQNGIQNKRKQYTKELSNFKYEIMNKIYSKIKSEIKQISKKNDFDYIIDDGSFSESLFISENKFDLTLNSKDITELVTNNLKSVNISNSNVYENISYLKDIDGNKYKIETIGSQTWMLENLRVTKFNDGTPLVEGNKGNWYYFNPKGGVGQFAYLEFNKINNSHQVFYRHPNKIGGNNTFSKNICPKGWRLPNPEDWNILSNNLGNNAKKLFKIELTGIAHNNDDKPSFFMEQGQNTAWWSSKLSNTTRFNATAFVYIGIGQYKSGKIVEFGNANVSKGYCIRCIKN